MTLSWSAYPGADRDKKRAKLADPAAIRKAAKITRLPIHEEPGASVSAVQFRSLSEFRRYKLGATLMLIHSANGVPPALQGFMPGYNASVHMVATIAIVGVGLYTCWTPAANVRTPASLGARVYTIDATENHENARHGGCARCGLKPPEGVETWPKCSRCKMQRYCSTACQRAHWPAHKRQCDIVKARDLATAGEPVSA